MKNGYHETVCKYLYEGSVGNNLFPIWQNVIDKNEIPVSLLITGH